MKINEILCESEVLLEKFVIKKSFGKNWYYGIGDHFMAQLALPERNVPWSYIERIVKRFPYIKPQLEQMISFNRFYVRDEETNVELGCKITSFGDPELKLVYVNTIVISDHVRKSDTPTIIAIGKV